MKNGYKDILLDTNIISNILKNSQKECLNFTNKFINNNYIPCISLTSIFELRRSKELYEKFLNIFSIFTLKIVNPHYNIVKSEMKNYNEPKEIDPIIFQCSLLKEDGKLQEFLEVFLSKEDNIEYEKNYRENNQRTIDEWYSNELYDFNNKVANKTDGAKFVKYKVPIRLNNIDKDFVNIHATTLDVNRFPTLQVILYSQYYRVSDKSYEQKGKEVNDVRISATAPYFDAVLIENRQAEIIKKLKTVIKKLENIEIYTMKDILK